MLRIVVLSGAFMLISTVALAGVEGPRGTIRICRQPDLSLSASRERLRLPALLSATDNGRVDSKTSEITGDSWPLSVVLLKPGLLKPGQSCVDLPAYIPTTSRVRTISPIDRRLLAFQAVANFDGSINDEAPEIDPDLLDLVVTVKSEFK